MKKILASVVAVSLSAAVAPASPAAEAGKLEAGDYVAIVGDSITEQRQYSVFIEDYLLMCKPVENGNLSATQFGWGGETSWGFASRMENDMLRFHCVAATTCFGMNDGGYSPETPQKEKQYHDAQTSVVEKMKKGGVRFIVVGSPGCVDSDKFHNDPASAVMYNKTLAAERDIAKKVAEEQGVGYADVFDPMVEVMEKAKAKYGHAYHLAGGDGVHPDANGHLVMAYAFLKGLGCKGDVGTITVDLSGNKAEATAGHQVKGVKDGEVEIESSRYPFCFYGDDLKATGSTKGVVEFFPFNQDLNRLTLVVHNAPSGKNLKVTWGKAAKTFSAEQLGSGINLAAEFLDNPFSEPFHKVEDVIRQQQNYETPLVKQLIHDLPAYKDAAPEEAQTLDRIASSLIKKDKTLVDASAAAVKPVTYTIKIEVEK